MKDGTGRCPYAQLRTPGGSDSSEACIDSSVTVMLGHPLCRFLRSLEWVQTESKYPCGADGAAFVFTPHR